MQVLVLVLLLVSSCMYICVMCVLLFILRCGWFHYTLVDLALMLALMLMRSCVVLMNH
jgi:hypothetical protein